MLYKLLRLISVFHKCGHLLPFQNDYDLWKFNKKNAQIRRKLLRFWLNIISMLSNVTWLLIALTIRNRSCSSICYLINRIKSIMKRYDQSDHSHQLNHLIFCTSKRKKLWFFKNHVVLDVWFYPCSSGVVNLFLAKDDNFQVARSLQWRDTGHENTKSDDSDDFWWLLITLSWLTLKCHKCL